VPSNGYGQPVGDAVAGWSARPRPPLTPMEGTHCRIVPAVPDHAEALFAAFAGAKDDRDWTYLPYARPPSVAAYRDFIAGMQADDSALLHTIIDRESKEPLGVAAYLRIDPVNGSIEVGSINYAPVLQRTAAATEAMVLMMARAFDALGYRRYEWKCNALNARSRAAALRLGFSYEGTFRNAQVVKGRNRDTAWFSIVDTEWPAIKRAQQQWLAPENFDSGRRQRQRLGELIAEARG
jgi:RimJ/RimL family protein N-acetyltransferase